jgi:GT2 family glycosyltransferase
VRSPGHGPGPQSEPAALDAAARVRVDGKQFCVAGRRFPFRGVTYGTFRPRPDGARFPHRDRMARDFAAMRAAGFTVVRTYTAPSEDMVELAAASGLRLLAGLFHLDWRYVAGAGRRELHQVAAEARGVVARDARLLAGNPSIVGLSVGNEIPADVVRWFGARAVAGFVRELVEAVRKEDGDALVTYANYPSAEYLPLPTLDFLTFNVFLEQRVAFRRYLNRLQHLAADRPLVLGEIGLHAGDTEAGEARQAQTLDWQLGAALERGVAGTCIFSWTDEWWVGDAEVTGWRFGLTRADRSPRPAMDVARRHNTASPARLRERWPALSVIICAHNQESTLDECLRHTCALDYPDLEVLVVDDGSTDRTATIAHRYPRARLLSIPHGGLSVARNHGLAASRGDVVAYLDADAYPSREWPYYLVLGLDAPTVGAVGGPNIPPPDEGPAAQAVARSPGGPLHVLLSDDRAEHVPGCNMAFVRDVLEEVGGFDPVYTAAGDDVDVCWKVLDRGYEIGFHPAALVWHRRRDSLRGYLRQQRGYGRAEALVERSHPDRFTSTGTARWRGRVYDSSLPPVAGGRIYRGLYGSAGYQSVYRGGGHTLDLAHQLGVPLATLALAAAVLIPLSTAVAALPLAGIGLLGLLFGIDAWHTQPPRQLPHRALRIRLTAAALHIAQPLARSWGRLRENVLARRPPPPAVRLPGPVSRVGRGILVVPQDRPRPQLAADLVSMLRRTGLRVVVPTGWEDYDARLLPSLLIAGHLVTSGHPPGCTQIRIRRRLRGFRAGAVAVAFGVVALVSPPVAWALAALAVADIARGAIRLRRLLGTVVESGNA